MQQSDYDSATWWLRPMDHILNLMVPCGPWLGPTINKEFAGEKKIKVNFSMIGRF